MVSDGDVCHDAMLGSQHADLVTSGELSEGSIIEVDDFVCNTVSGKKFIILPSVAVVQTDAAPVGHPARLDALPQGPRGKATAAGSAQPGAAPAAGGSSHGAGHPQGHALGPVSPPPRTGGEALPRRQGAETCS